VKGLLEHFPDIFLIHRAITDQCALHHTGTIAECMALRGDSIR
jgi:hypothetical protein